MSLSKDIAELAKYIPVIAAKRNYWFVRTDGGNYYEDFVNGNFIAIGYNEVSLADISIVRKGEQGGLDALSDRIRQVYPDELRPGHIASQLERFAYKIKKGDIVIIPSENSTILHFGEVVSTPVYIDNIGHCDYTKRKQIKWLKNKPKVELQAELYKLIFTHQTVSDANEYADLIDRTLHKIYIKGDYASLVIPVRTKEKVKTTDFYDFGTIFSLSSEFCKDEGIDTDVEYNIQSKVQSPGELVITTLSILGVISIGLILNAIAGGGFSFKFSSTEKETKAETSAKTDGIIEKVRVALNSKANRKAKAEITKEAMKNMKINSPDELVKILDKFDENK
jgi:restriction system protein